VYTDDICSALEDPEAFYLQLEKKYKFNLKGVGPIYYHLGADYRRDEDGTLRQSAESYIEKILDNFRRSNDGKDPYNKNTPVPENSHPELDESPELDDNGRSLYQSMIGCLQWCITLGRVDLLCTVMVMSRFRAAPRVGHMDLLRHAYGYLKKHKQGAIRYRTELPKEMMELGWTEYDWIYSVYGEVKEADPVDMPKLKGNPVVLSAHVDANLMSDLITGWLATCVLHHINGTLFDWYAKRQDTVETATYGSEMVAACLATDQIIANRHTLRYLGIPIIGPTHLFGDNQSVVTSTTIPHSQLQKRHNFLAYHCIREAIAAGIIRFYHVTTDKNLADIGMKFMSGLKLQSLTQPLLFMAGYIRSIYDQSGRQSNNVHWLDVRHL